MAPTRFLMISFIWFSVAVAMAQTPEPGKRSGVILFTEFTATTQRLKAPLTSSPWRPGAGLGLSQWWNLYGRTELHLGACLYGYSIRSRDYSLVFPDDVDPLGGGVDYRRSYYQNTSHILQVNIPVQFRFNLGQGTKGFFISPGVEGRVVIDDVTEARLRESGQHEIKLSHEPFYDVKSSGLAVSLDVGFVPGWQKHQMQFSLLCRYGLSRQFEGVYGSFQNMVNGRPLDLGLRVGLEL